MDHTELTVYALLVVGVLALAGGVAWLQAHNEAASFRKLTGRTDVTTWDAIWVELRVDCERLPQ
jgi:hypothetical protein